jgi:hypothetical protein
METSVHWNHAASYPDEDGIAWVEAAGPTGSVAVGGGGWGSFNVDGVDDIPTFPIVAMKPEDGVPQAWMFGVVAPLNGPPDEPAVKVHCFVVCLEDIPS